ncbi:hypothetical protein M427DRAFT_65122 [Gonapodya prolifera JEL478]|uniref:MOSC domain-containing protein n=1 Tax=Gonapodya prolifera (strain JEL478) TaxID=1344416 RepID=A0A139AZ23_GONPJ|nr:hypothetical protein M427DRAFT_65122 [Gonapodya prolifera JEL478]|eukprot:KXS22002.1 hypothetical protein M427DRAFT_65122 [Gonapodya prolifera JEL478]
MLKVKNLYMYPVKSCRGLELNEATIANHGFAFDRQWMIVREDFASYSEPAHTRIVTMRDVPTVILITPKLDLNEPVPGSTQTAYERGGTLTLSHPKASDTVAVPFPCKGKSISFEVFGDPVQVVDCGDAAALWLSAICGESVRLVVNDYQSCAPRVSTNTYGDDPILMPEAASKVTVRHCVPVGHQLPPPYSIRAQAAFADAYPYLLVSTGSMRDLNAHLAERVTQGKGDLSSVRPINFRPNIVVENEVAFEEDTWMAVKIGGSTIHVLSRATRCMATTVDPDTAQKTKDPLTTIQSYRRVEPNAKYEACFGMWGVHEPECVGNTIKVGDEIDVLKTGAHGKAPKKK